MLTTDEKREYLDWTRQGADSYGDCDRCHALGSLWSLPADLDDEPDAGWQYCEHCFTRIINRS